MLVLGGDCTVGVGTVAGSRLAGGRTGLVYLDMHADLNVPSSVVDGALDWMGMAHMLGVEGCLPELADLASPFVPMLDPSQVVVLGHEHSQATDWELSVIAERSIAVVAAEALRADPAAAAQRALAQLADATRVIVHLDVDVVDFVDAPLSENTGRNVGVPLAAVAAALPVLMADRRTAALTVTELNPVHAAADPGCLGRLVDALVAAIAPLLSRPPPAAPAPAAPCADRRMGWWRCARASCRSRTRHRWRSRARTAPSAPTRSRCSSAGRATRRRR